MVHEPSDRATVRSAKGESILVELVGRSEPQHGHPSATTVLDEDGVRVVAFEFGAGDALKEHAAPHPALVQVVRGRVNFTLPDGVVDLAPGRVLHLTAGLRHAVDAVEPTTLTVTLLPVRH